MKTYLTAIILMIACQHTFAQSTDKLFEMFRNEQGADYVKVSPLMMKVAQLFTSDQSTESRFIKGIKSAQVLDLEECDTATKERFKKQAAELELKEYETLFVAKEDGETLVVVTADHGTGGMKPDGKGGYKFTSGQHDFGDVPVFVSAEDAGFVSGKEIKNRQIPVQIARVLGFDESQFPAQKIAE